jgi:RNA polymerase sigma factor (sigma-70 family)
MKISDPGAATLHAATAGDLAALGSLLVTIQPGVFNLAVRMLGNRDDAADATQEILLKVVTHLSSFRGAAAFTTWVFQVARNHLLNAATRNKESPEVSLDAIAERLQAGLDFASAHLGGHDVPRVLTPEDKLASRQVALGCTQNMLMALDREQRLVYLLDTVFGLPSKEAAEVMDLTPEAYRQRLSRARVRLDGFINSKCGLANTDAPCRCERQLPALRNLRAQGISTGGDALAIPRAERAQAEAQFASIVRMADAAAAFRAHPDYRAPDSLIGAIRAVLRTEGHWDDRTIQ